MNPLKFLANKVAEAYLFDSIFKKKISRHSNSLIYVIGDSHVSVFSGRGTKEENFMVSNWPNKIEAYTSVYYPLRIGPITAYNSFKKINKLKKILSLRSLSLNKKKDLVILCFGEIDIRVHLLKKAAENKIDLNIVINDCIKNYVKTIYELINNDYKLIVYGPIASSLKGVVIDKYSSYGSCIERNMATKKFNELLQIECKKLQTPFISIFEEMINEKYETSPDYLMDDIHLSAKYLPMITEKLKNQGLI